MNTVLLSTDLKKSVKDMKSDCNKINLKTGDILHCTRKSLLSWLIRKVTKSKFNHTALVIEIWGQTYILESQNDGTQLKPFALWQKKWGYKYEISRPIHIDTVQFSKKALSKTSTGYDFTTLLIRGPWKILTGKWKKKKNEFDKMYCSEYVAWCYDIEYESIMSPQGLWEYCQEHNDVFQKLIIEKISGNVCKTDDNKE